MNQGGNYALFCLLYRFGFGSVYFHIKGGEFKHDENREFPKGSNEGCIIFRNLFIKANTLKRKCFLQDFVCIYIF